VEAAFKRFESAAVMAIKLLLMVAVALGILILYTLFISGVRASLATIDSVHQLQTALQHVFAGVLLVLLGLELIETLNSYTAEHRIRIEVVLIVAMIALGRHIVQIDFEQMSAPGLLGMAALMMALAASYFLASRVHRESKTRDEKADR
jgi:uncharacterized membrane protein (DUF373 family)